MLVMKHYSAKNLSTFGLIAALIAIYFIPHELLFENKTEFCIHKKILHFDCPGCGMTRAIHMILHGYIIKATMYNMAIIPFVIAAASYLIHSISAEKTLNNLYSLSLKIFTITIIGQYAIKASLHLMSRVA